MTRTLAILLLTLVPGFALAQPSAQPAADSRVYELRTYYAAPGKLDALHARFRNHTLRLYEKHGITSVGYWVPAENPDHKLVYLVAHPSESARQAAWARLAADPEWVRIKRATEKDGRLVDAIADQLLTPAEVSALIARSEPQPRLFELRTYTAAPGKLGELTAEVRGRHRELSERDRATPLAAWTPTPGQKGADTTLVSLIAHKAPADGESFVSRRQGPPTAGAIGIALVSAIEPRDGERSVLLVPTDYSPLK